MLMRALVYAVALLLSTQAYARAHRRRPREAKIFAADRDSVLRENEAGNAMGALRYFTQPMVDQAVLRGELVPLGGPYVISPKLTANRRYALPSTVQFLEELGVLFYAQFHKQLMVDSAIRPATTQRELHLRNAAAAYGDRASTHERGTTVDVSKNLTRAQRQWLVSRLLYYWALGRVLVIQERGCYHIFVKGE